MPARLRLYLMPLLLLFLGCNTNPYGPLGSIEGKLTVKGETAPAGTKVLFMGPASGHAGYALTNETGNYKIEWRKSGATYPGLPVGKYEVMIIPTDLEDSDNKTAEEMLNAEKPKSKKKPELSIPSKYMRASTSGLVYTIVEGKNDINIDVMP